MKKRPMESLIWLFNISLFQVEQDASNKMQSHLRLFSLNIKNGTFKSSPRPGYCLLGRKSVYWIPACY